MDAALLPDQAASRSDALYGEEPRLRAEFWVHGEAISTRSRQHDWTIRPHRHDRFFQLFHVTAGGGTSLFDGKAVPVEAPCLISIPPRARHGFAFRPDVDGLVLTFVPGGLGPVRHRMAGPSLPLGAARVTTLDPVKDDHRLVMSLIAAVGRNVAADDTPADLAEAALSTALLLIERIVAEDSEAANAMLNETERRVEVLRDLVRRHAREHRDVGFYARALGVSATHLNRLARRIAGRSVGELIAERLMDEAKRELVFTMLTVQQVAYGLGFSDPAYFSRFFRQHAGLTPQAYRERERSMA